MPPETRSHSSSRRSIETISIGALIGSVVLAVLLFIPSNSIPFLPTKTFILGAGTLLTLALYILARLGRGNMIVPPLALMGALWLPTIAYALSAAFSGASLGNAFWGTSLEPDTLGFMLIASILGTLAAIALRRPEHYRTFFASLLWGAGAVVVIEVLVLLVGQIAPNFVSPAFSFVGSSEDMAILFGLGIISALLTMRFLELSNRTHLLMLIGGGLGLFVLAVLNSSLVWTLLALVSLGLFVEAVMKRRPSASEADLDDASVVHESAVEGDSGNRSLVTPLVVLAVSIFFLIGGNLSGALANALHVQVLSVRPSWQSTLAVTHKVYSDSPVFGTGPGTFGTEWLKYRDASVNSTAFWNIDFSSGIGLIPTSFVTTGIVGALAWIGMLGLLLVLGLRMLIMRAPEDSYTRFAAILSFVGATYLFITAIFGLPGPVMLALAFIFAGLFASTMRYSARAGQWGIVFAKAPRIGFIIVFSLTLILLGSVGAAYALIERYAANVELARANAAVNAGNLDGADAAVQSALAFAASPDAYLAQAGLASVRLNQIVSSTTMTAAVAQQEFQAALSAGINAALTATRIAPNNYQAWLALGNLYAAAVPLNVEGSYDSAKTAYDKAFALNPTNPVIPYTIAGLDIAHKDSKKAEDDLKAAIALKQDYTPAIFLLSQLYVADGNVKDALNSALAAAYFTPNDPNVLFQVGILRAASNDLPGAVEALSAAVSVNPQFANARYFLAAVYARQKDYAHALEQIKAIAAMSDDNAKAVADAQTTLAQSKDPFPANLLSVSSTPVK